MNWYIVKMIFRIEGERIQSIQFDEQWRMIQAMDKASALEKAAQIGAKESSIQNRPNGDKVEWQFEAISDVVRFNHQLDGAEVFSRIEVPDKPGYYLHSLWRKAADLSVRNKVVIEH